MSLNILQSIAKERDLLDGPKMNKPSVQRLYGATVRNFQDMYNLCANSDEAWTFDETDLIVTGGTDTYPIPGSKLANFGKPLLLTTYSTDDYAVERIIPFWDIQNLNFDWFLPKNYPGWNPLPTGGDHSAERVSFFYGADGTPKLRFAPVPQTGATYRLKFSIGNWADSANIQASPILSNHHHLFEVRSAKDTLYMAEWNDVERKDLKERRNEIRSYLDEMENRFLPAFKDYLKEMTHEGITFMKAWDD